MDELEPNQFTSSQSTIIFTEEQLLRLAAQAKSLNSKAAMQYALGTLEPFEAQFELVPR